jgi:ubiquinone/menaquinone biosynthesis C-methylase UbiE
MDEIKRIKTVYSKRERIIKDNRYSPFNIANLYNKQQRERGILKLLDKYHMNPLTDKKILDVGCGGGGSLRSLIQYGALPQNVYGIDLLPNRIEHAKKLSPNINFHCGNAEELPYENRTFDMVMQFTTLTSILDYQMKHRIAHEMLRVLKCDGIILWYDFHMNNPQNPEVRGIGRKEIIQLFPSCEYEFRRLTLAPPLSRRVAPYSWIACYLLEKIPFLCTHYLAVIKRKPKQETHLKEGEE